MMFAELKVRGSKVRIPFVCRMCGECCRKLSKVVYDPRDGKVYMEDLDVDYVDIPEEYREFSHPIKIPCPFLKDNVCSIYSIRPKSCRDFPLLTGDLGVNCPALKSLKRFLEAFNPDEVKYVVEDDVDPIVIPKEFLKLFKSLNPTKEELKAFMRLNKVRHTFKLSKHLDL